MKFPRVIVVLSGGSESFLSPGDVLQQTGGRYAGFRDLPREPAPGTWIVDASAIDATALEATAGYEVLVVDGRGVEPVDCGTRMRWLPACWGEVERTLDAEVLVRTAQGLESSGTHPLASLPATLTRLSPAAQHALQVAWPQVAVVWDAVASRAPAADVARTVSEAVCPVALPLMLDGEATLAAPRPSVLIRATPRSQRLLTVIPARPPASRHAVGWLEDVLGPELARQLEPEPNDGPAGRAAARDARGALRGVRQRVGGPRGAARARKAPRRPRHPARRAAERRGTRQPLACRRCHRPGEPLTAPANRQRHSKGLACS